MKIFTTRALIFAGLILLMLSASSSLNAQSKKKRATRMKSSAVLPKPADSELREMVEKTLLDFNEAVQRADFGEFYANICRPWQEQISAKEMQEVFQGFIDKEIDISEISGMDAVFLQKPIIKKYVGYYTLVIQGYYPTSPNRTKFTLHFITDDKKWKLFTD